MKKGIALLSVIIIMTSLNIILLSLVSTNKNPLKTSIMSIESKENDIYISSTQQIADYIILDIFKKSLESIHIEYIKNNDDVSISKLMAHFTNIIFDDNNLNPSYTKNNYNLQIQNGRIYSKDNTLNFEIQFINKTYNNKYLNIQSYITNDINYFIDYTLTFTNFLDEDIENIKNGNIEAIYEKYKKDFISKKFIFR